jgi:periplasmic protein TonB
MPDLLPRFSSSFQNAGESWLSRVYSNALQLAHGTALKISSANGAPLHLLDLRTGPRLGRAQSASMLTHAAIIAAFVAWFIHPPANLTPRISAAAPTHELTPISPDLLRQLLGDHPSSGSGQGSGRNPLPATTGHPPPISSIQLLQPSLPQKAEPQLAVPPTILDPNAPAVLTPVVDIGLPWMKDKTNSPGPGTGNTIGNSNGHTMGDGDEGPVGEGHSGTPYRAGVTRPSCAYCPDPMYTDEAREAKVQGIVTLEVLVGADGRAAQIHVTKGIGMGLEERTLQAVRGWHFTPARDAAHRPVAAWVTIEVLFRLY